MVHLHSSGMIVVAKCETVLSGSDLRVNGISAFDVICHQWMTSQSTLSDSFKPKNISHLIYTH